MQSAVDAANPGDTINIGAGSCTWSAYVYVTKSVKIVGAGQASTIITLGASNDMFYFDLTSGTLEVTGFKLIGPGYSGMGAINLDGSYTSLRIHHITFQNMGVRAIVIGYDTWYRAGAAAIYGLIDNITYTNTACRQFTLQYGINESWLSPDDFGSANAMYLEDSNFTYTQATWDADCDIWDAEHGGRYVVRHNNITGAFIGGHDTGSTGISRGQRKHEVYSNIMTAPAGMAASIYSAFGLRGGTGVFYDNQISLQGSTGFQVAGATEIWRRTNATGQPWDFLCTGTQQNLCSDFYPHCSGGNNRACGINENIGSACTTGGGSGTCVNHPSACGTGVTLLSYIDGTSTSGGYPCRDQTGRGQDQGANHSQLNAPIYWWNNTDPNNANALITSANIDLLDLTYITFNRDIFVQVASFNGTAGVGRGSLSLAGLGTCSNTTYPGPGYFSTTDNTLYVCDSLNHWTARYTPYTYPHLLQGGGAVSPAVTTTSATSITTTTASSGGNVTSDGGATVTARGVCYAITANPTTPCTSDGTGIGAFTSSLTGLIPGTLYHYRAYATNSAGTGYGSDLTFTTTTILSGMGVSGAVSYAGTRQ